MRKKRHREEWQKISLTVLFVAFLTPRIPVAFGAEFEEAQGLRAFEEFIAIVGMLAQFVKILRILLIVLLFLAAALFVLRYIQYRGYRVTQGNDEERKRAKSSCILWGAVIVIILGILLIFCFNYAFLLKPK